MPRSGVRVPDVRRRLLIALVATVPVSSAMAQSDPARPRPTAPAMTAGSSVVTPSDYVIGADDVLAVVFWKEPELSAARVRVRPDGKISLPLVGEVAAAGLVPDDLKRRLETLAKPFLADPTAAVMVSEINSRKVFITGAVGQPGGFRLNSPITVLQAVALAGGFSESAERDRVEIISSIDNRPSRQRLSYKAIVKGKAADVALKPGDTVVVW